MSCKAVFPPLLMIAMLAFLIWFCSDVLVENAEVAHQHGELMEAYENHRELKLNSYADILEKIETERSQAIPDSVEIQRGWDEIRKFDKNITQAQKALELFEERHEIASEHCLNERFDENGKLVNLAKPHDALSVRETNNIVMGIAMGTGALTAAQGICQQNRRRKIALIVFGVLMMCVAGFFLGYNSGNPDVLQASKIVRLATYSIFGCAIFAQLINVIHTHYDAKDNTEASEEIQTEQKPPAAPVVQEPSKEESTKKITLKFSAQKTKLTEMKKELQRRQTDASSADAKALKEQIATIDENMEMVEHQYGVRRAADEKRKIADEKLKELYRRQYRNKYNPHHKMYDEEAKRKYYERRGDLVNYLDDVEKTFQNLKDANGDLHASDYDTRQVKRVKHLTGKLSKLLEFEPSRKNRYSKWLLEHPNSSSETQHTKDTSGKWHALRRRLITGEDTNDRLIKAMQL